MLEQWVFSLWGALTTFGNSGFGAAVISAAIGSLAGAWGGAYAIQRIADRAKRREIYWNEVVRTNKAIEIGHGILNTYLNVKEQYVRDMSARFEQHFLIVNAYDEALRQGTISPDTPPPQLGKLDLFTLTPIEVRIDRLEDLVLDHLNVSGRPRLLVHSLRQSIGSFALVQKDHNDHVNAIKSMVRGGMIGGKELALMFGLPSRNGVRDYGFATAVRGMLSANHECIHLSMLLYRDLRRHGLEARQTFLQKFRGEVPEITHVDYSEPERKGLFPDPARFVEWETHVQRRLRKSKGRRVGKGWYWLRKRWRHALLKPWGRWKKRRRYLGALQAAGP